MRDVLAGDAARAVGSAVGIGSGARTVTAVLPPEFACPNDQVGIWLPWRVPPMEVGYSQIVARLRPGVSPAQLRDSAARVAPDLKIDPGNAVSVTPLGESIVGGMRRLLLAAVAGSLLVFSVACANVATLVIGRDMWITVICARRDATDRTDRPSCGRTDDPT